jgi:hypothetical protein
VLTAAQTAYNAATQAPTGVAYTVERGNPVTIAAPAAANRLFKVLITAPTLEATMVSEGVWLLGLELEYALKFGAKRPMKSRDWKV